MKARQLIVKTIQVTINRLFNEQMINRQDDYEGMTINRPANNRDYDYNRLS
jgi:hypothetical protein